VVEEVPYEAMEDMVMARTLTRPGRDPETDEVWFVDIPPGEMESFGC
jgi:hypothetical protein